MSRLKNNSVGRNRKQQGKVTNRPPFLLRDVTLDLMHSPYIPPPSCFVSSLGYGISRRAKVNNSFSRTRCPIIPCARQQRRPSIVVPLNLIARCVPMTHCNFGRLKTGNCLSHSSRRLSGWRESWAINDTLAQFSFFDQRIIVHDIWILLGNRYYRFKLCILRGLSPCSLLTILCLKLQYAFKFLISASKFIYRVFQNNRPNAREDVERIQVNENDLYYFAIFAIIIEI